MAFFNDGIEVPASYGEVWQRPEVTRLLMEHERERAFNGVHARFKEVIQPMLRDMKDDLSPEVLRTMAGGELPLVLVAPCSTNTGVRVLRAKLETADPLALMRVNPNSGKLIGPFVSIAEVKEGVLEFITTHGTDEDFYDYQCDLMLEQANQQIAVGLHPNWLFHSQPENGWASNSL